MKGPCLPGHDHHKARSPETPGIFFYDSDMKRKRSDRDLPPAWRWNDRGDPHDMREMRLDDPESGAEPDLWQHRLSGWWSALMRWGKVI